MHICIHANILYIYIFFFIWNAAVICWERKEKTVCQETVIQFAVIPFGCVYSMSNIIKWATLDFSVCVDGVMTPCLKVHSCKSDWSYNTDMKYYSVKLLNADSRQTGKGVCSSRFFIFERLITPVACAIGNLLATLHSWTLNVMWVRIRAKILSGSLFFLSLFGFGDSAWFPPLYFMFFLSPHLCPILDESVCLFLTPYPPPAGCPDCSHLSVLPLVWVARPWQIPSQLRFASAAVGSGSIFLPGLWCRPAASHRDTIITQSNTNTTVLTDHSAGFITVSFTHQMHKSLPDRPPDISSPPPIWPCLTCSIFSF